jgi:membrane-associated phospholipid phosphatase
MSGQTRLDKKGLSKVAYDPRYRIARTITNITVPPFLAIPTYILVAGYDSSRNGPSTNFWLGLFFAVTFGVTMPVIMVLLMRSLNKVTDVHIPLREQRTVPFILGILCYIAGTFLLWLLYGSYLLTAVMFCYTINSTIVLVINFYWKISVHATGVGGPLAALTVIYGWPVAPLFLLIPLVGWARVFLKAHTLGQVVAGSVLGFILTLVQLLLIFRPLGWF